MISQDSLQFLEDLKHNNNREWFLANKKRYEVYKKEYAGLVADFLTVMSAYDDSLKNLEVKDCTFRINRDIRFSKDKSPYKTHLGIWMSAGNKITNLAGYYIQIEKGASFIAGGVHWPDGPDLKKIRKEIAFFHEDLEKIVNDKKFKSTFGELDRNAENSLKTAPKDFEKDHPAIEFLKLKSVTATATFDDEMLSDINFVKNISEKLLELKPLIEFLNRALQSE